MCKHCNLVNCSILNKSECPINKLWESEVKRIDTILTKQYGIKLDNLLVNASQDYWNAN